MCQPEGADAIRLTDDATNVGKGLLSEPTELDTASSFGHPIAESPRWHEGRLWFCHWGAHEVIALDVVTGEQDVVLHDEDVQPHSIDFLPDGRMLVVPGAPDDERLLRVEPDDTFATHADLGALGRWWNELVVDDRGGVYVDSVGFDFMAFLGGRGEPSPDSSPT